jgi:uncharacterized protein Veg
MKSFEIITDVKNGSFSRNINRIKEAIRSYEGKTLTLSLKLARKERSISQNNYYWAVIVVIWKKLIQDEWGEFFTSQEVHEFLKYNCNYKEHIDEETGEILRVSKSTKENSTTEQEEFHSRARELAHTMFKCDIPLPNEQINIEL